MKIAEAAARCLKTMTASLEVEELMKAVWAENRLADFNLWITGTGALANSRLSLETRLQSKPEVREVITNLLNLLALAMDECQKIATGEDPSVAFEEDGEEEQSGLLNPPSGEISARSFSPWFDDSSSDEQSLEELNLSSSTNSSLPKSMQNVEMILGQLAQISIAIRRSGKSSRLQRADHLFKLKDHGELQTHLRAMILLSTKKISSGLNTDMVDKIKNDDLSKIQQRLILCNLRRRNRFLYAQRHSQSLGSNADGDTEGSEDTAYGGGNPNSKDKEDRNKKPLSSTTKDATEEEKAPINPTIMTGTRASALSDSFALPESTPSSQTASTILSSTVIGLKYPQPPKITDGVQTFACPCCCQTLPVEFLKEKIWKKHITNDLSPYTCIIEGCANPLVLYTTKKEWRQHMLDRHQGIEYWICFSCEGAEQFRSKEQFIQHTKTKHEPFMESGQISLLVDICRRTAPLDITSCPLCNWPEDEKVVIDKNTLLDHIAKDLHAFSLRSLPWDDDNGQESETQIFQSSEKVFEWLVNNELWKNPSMERPPLDKRVYTSNYFRHSPYFADDLVSSTSSEHDSATSRDMELKKMKETEGSAIFESTAVGGGPLHNTQGSAVQPRRKFTGTNGIVPLVARLRQALVTNPREHRRFIPRLQLEEICNEQAVAQELATAFPGNDVSFYERRALAICYGQTQDSSITFHPCRRIFAVLVLINEVRLIESFLRHPLCDKDLPLHGTADYTALGSHQREPGNYLYFPAGYDNYDIVDRFIEQQWLFLAPYLSSPATGLMRFKVYELHEKTVLPIEYISKKQYPSGFGLVEKVKIHSEHNGFNHESFALKTMYPMIPKERDRFFQQEIEIFQAVKPGGHIIEPCAAFKKGETCSFLFPWAEGSTLNRLWAREPHDIIASVGVQWPEFSRWICIQCHGIIRDLWAIHEPYGILPGNDDEDYGVHSDIKPDNILYFSQDGPPLGSLKVSDVGLMKFQRLISRTVQSKSMGLAYQTYRAPEYDMGKARSRKIDIWAFGCLFAEFVTWAIGGENAIEAFKMERIEEDKRFPEENKGGWFEDNFFIIQTSHLNQGRVPKRKRSIDEVRQTMGQQEETTLRLLLKEKEKEMMANIFLKWFTALITDLGPNMANTFFPQFLRFIQNSMLEPDRNYRVDCKRVESFLGKTLQENPPDSLYWRFNGTTLYPYSKSSTGTGTW